MGSPPGTGLPWGSLWGGGGGAEDALALSGEEKGAAAVWLLLRLAPAARTGLTGLFTGWRAAVVHCGNAALGPTSARRLRRAAHRAVRLCESPVPKPCSARLLGGRPAAGMKGRGCWETASVRSFCSSGCLNKFKKG